MTATAAVIIDYQNIHLTAHDCFAPPGTPKHETLIHPLLFAEQVMERRRAALAPQWMARVPDLPPNRRTRSRRSLPRRPRKPPRQYCVQPIPSTEIPMDKRPSRQGHLPNTALSDGTAPSAIGISRRREWTCSLLLTRTARQCKERMTWLFSPAMTPTSSRFWKRMIPIATRAAGGSRLLAGKGAND